MASSVRDGGLIITIKEARKLLGKEAEGRTDEEVERQIIELDFVAGVNLRRADAVLKSTKVS
ncbi:MAG: hypothetical protein JWN01_163 [Patescibacteria group bacterium]|nr:hypothetical protein [Patescibacteria group bacterium]